MLFLFAISTPSSQPPSSCPSACLVSTISYPEFVASSTPYSDSYNRVFPSGKEKDLIWFQHSFRVLLLLLAASQSPAASQRSCCLRCIIQYLWHASCYTRIPLTESFLVERERFFIWFRCHFQVSSLLLAASHSHAVTQRSCRSPMFYPLPRCSATQVFSVLH